MKQLNTIFIFFFFINVGFGQVIHYDVMKGSKKLGDMTVERRINGNDIIYDINSSVTFRLLFSFTVDFKSYARYANGLLAKEYTLNELNGRVQNEAELNKLDKGYELKNGGVPATIYETINYSISAIYFQEPEDGQTVFSPTFGQFLKFEKIREGTYEMDSPDGLNTYEYTNGICTKVNVVRDFAKFSFEITPESMLVVKNKSIFSGAGDID